MTSPTYYFINHTHKEFCVFDNNSSVMKSLENVIKAYINWSLMDDIRIDTDLPTSTIVLEYLINEMEFRNLDLYID